MNFLTFLFFLSLFIFVVCSLFRFFIFRAIKKKLKAKFRTYKFIPGIFSLSIQNITAEGATGSLEVGESSVRLSFFNIWHFKHHPFIHLSISRLHAQIDSNKLQDPIKRSKYPLDKWIVKHLFAFLSAIIIRSIQIDIEDVEITTKKGTFNAHSLCIKYNRSSQKVSTSISIEEFSLSKTENYIRIPRIHLSGTSTIQSIKYILNSAVYEFIGTAQEIVFDFADSQLHFNSLSFNCIVPKDPEVNMNLMISSFSLLFPHLDLNTKTISASIGDFMVKYGKIKAGQVIIIRNNQPLITAPAMKFSKKRLSFPYLDLVVALPLIIDFGLIRRFFKGPPNPIRRSSTNPLLSSLQIYSPKVLFKLCLSDNHILCFTLRKVIVHYKMISAKHLVLDALFPSQVYRFCEADKCQLNFARPLFGLKCVRADFILSSDFAEQSFIQEVMNLLSFASKQIKGDVSSFRDSQPPTRRIFSFEAHACNVKMARNRLTSKISRYNEARRLAMEALLVRQNKAIQIMQAQKLKKFNEEEFNLASRKILFDLYKTTLNQMPPSDDTLFEINASEFSIVLNGPAVANRAKGIEKIVEIVPDIEQEDIGRVTGGALSIKSSHLEVHASEYGKLISIDNLLQNGFLMIGKRLGKIREDFFAFKITCDAGDSSFLVPNISSRSVFFFNLNVNCSKMNILYTPVFSQFKQDFKLGTLIFRKKKYRFKKIRTFDQFRIRFRFKINFNSEHFELGYNDKRYPFNHFPQYTFSLPKLDIVFDGKDFHINSANAQARVLSGLEYKLFVSLPAPSVRLTVISHNPNQAKRPVFIPFDSYRMNDPTYDPYVLYRTHTYSVDADFKFGKTMSTINLDLLQNIFDSFVIKHSVLTLFVKPAYFVMRSHPHPTFSYININAILPYLSVSLFNEALNAKIYGEPISVNINTQNLHTYEVTSTMVKVQTTYNEQKLFNCHIDNFYFKKYGSSSNILMTEIIANVNSKIIGYRNNLPFKLPKSYKQYEIQDCLTINELQNNYTEPSFKATLGIFKLNLTMEEINRTMVFSGSEFMYEIQKDKQGAKLHTIALNNLNLITVDERIPFILFENSKIFIAKSSNVSIKFIDFAIATLNISEEDFNIFIPAIKKLLKDHKKEPKKVRTPHITRIDCSLQQLNVKLALTDCTIIFSCRLNQIEARVFRDMENNQKYSFKVQSIKAIHELATDNFKEVISTTQKPFLSLYFMKTRPIMKLPVFEKIEIELAHMVLHLNVQFIKDLIKFFPSSEEIRMLDFDEIENGEEEEAIEDFEALQKEIVDQGNENSIFCREIYFHPFNAELNLRFRGEGVFREFLEREIKYSGLHVGDMFGTKEEIISFIKRNLKWTAVKAISKILWRKKRRNTST